MITIDFETRSELDIRDVGSHVYAAHESTEIICLAALFPTPTPDPDLDDVLVWIPERFERISGVRSTLDLESLFLLIEEGELVEAHNSGFERRIWNLIGVDRLDWIPIPEDSWRCSQAKAGAQGLPRSLELLSEALEMGPGKDPIGRAAMLRLTSPVARATRDPRQGILFEEDSGPVFREDPADLIACFDYCRKDVLVEALASELLEDLSEDELEIWRLDQKINDRGLRVDRELCRSVISAIDTVDRSGELESITGGVVSSPNQVGAIKEFIESTGFPIGELRADDVDRYLESGRLCPEATRVLQIRQELAKSSTAKFKALLDRSSVDGRLRDLLRYYGAFTGRWSGSGAQIQNFPRGDGTDPDELAEIFLEDPELVAEFYGSIHDAAKNLLRGCLTADEGNLLLVWDFGQIEARALAWLADDPDCLEIFRSYDAGEGEDPYRVMAGEIFARDPEDVSKAERAVGKIAILGLGYAMGARAFAVQLEKFGAAQTSEKFAKRVVRTFRKKFSATVRFWSGVETAARETIQTGELRTVNSLEFRLDGRYLRIRLPSGRDLFYLDPELVADEMYGSQIQYRQVKNGKLLDVRTYGGKLVENLTQATARDLLADGMKRLDRAGYPINATIHDEIVSETPEDRALARFELGKKLLAKNENWSTGLPLVADGFISRRYRKD